jgi:hypothetical protein
VIVSVPTSNYPGDANVTTNGTTAASKPSQFTTAVNGSNTVISFLTSLYYKA